MTDQKKYGLQEQYFTKEDIDRVLKDMHIDPDKFEVDYEQIARDTCEAMDQDWSEVMERVIHDGEYNHEHIKPKEGTQ